MSNEVRVVSKVSDKCRGADTQNDQQHGWIGIGVGFEASTI
jgi:hypothetical protein